MYYIYCYTNKINGKCYVGQTNYLKRRIREHRSTAFNPKSSSYNHLFHKKMREYGEDNFEISVLEQGESSDVDYINEREKYWIAKKESYVSTGKGYNMDAGGSVKPHLYVLKDNELKDVKEKIKAGIPFSDICDEYCISVSFVSMINHGEYFYDSNEKYPLCKYYKDDEDYDKLIDLLLNSSLTLKDISDQLGIGYSTVKKINAGTLRKGLYPSYPIRKIDAREHRALKIKNLLKTTTLSYKEIASIINASEETVRRVNLGLVWKDDSLSYPIR